MTDKKKSLPLIRKPLFEFLSSMRFAVSLLSLLGIASVIGTVLKQNENLSNYAFEFGPFWFEIFQFLGLYDVYSATWFVGILVFLVISTTLCLVRNTPNFLKEMKSFRLKASETSLSAMKHQHLFSQSLSIETLTQYLASYNFVTKTETREDGSTLIAAKKGSANKLGYIFAHLALIVICVGGLIDSDVLLKTRIAFGQVVPDKTANYVNEFKPKSILDTDNLSFRGNIDIREGNTVDVVFLNTPKGALVQELPFTVNLEKFTVDYYGNGMPKNFVSKIKVVDKKTGEVIQKDLRVNHPLTVKGITLYQNSFSDGGSELNFKAWNLETPSKSANLNAVSMSNFPFNWGEKEKYTLEFGELRVYNIENAGEEESTIHDVRSVAKTSNNQNIGPSITYKLRDQTGQAYEYINYMSPIEKNEAFFLAAGVRKNVNDNFVWVELPLDKESSLKTFMLFKTAFKSAQMRKEAVDKVLNASPKEGREELRLVGDALMKIFTEKGYIGIQEFINRKDVPIAQEEKDKMGKMFMELLHRASNELLTDAQKGVGEETWPQSPERSQFVVNSMIAMTNLQDYGSPVYLQLENFNQVQASGIQMTRSPGKNIVYLGSLLLVFGIYFMFYIREKRIWFLIKESSLQFSMSSARNQNEIEHEFEQHKQNIDRLMKTE